VTNLVFGAAFVGAWLVAPSGILTEIAWFGLLINFLLAGFNMIPFGPRRQDGAGLEQRRLRRGGAPEFSLSLRSSCSMF